MKKSLLAVICILASANAYAASLAWNGSVSNLWSVAANWTPNAVPQSGDSLSFFDTGDVGGFYTMNDLPASNIYGSVQVGHFHEVSGNLVRVTTQIYGAFDAPVQAMGNLTGGTPTVTSDFNAFDVNGYDVFIGNAKFNGAVTGTGSIHGGVSDAPHGSLIFNANGTFSGTVINSGSTAVNADIGAASFQGDGSLGVLSGVARIGAVVSTAAVAPGGFDTYGTLTTGNLTLAAGPTAYAGYSVDVSGTGQDQLKVIGTVSIQGASLQVRANSPISSGQTFVIIDNDGSDPVVGTFSGMPEGAAIQSVDGSKSFRITYHGGDGNDVVLTTLTQPTAVTMTNSPSSSVTGQAVTLTATVTGSGPTPSGTVSFLDDNSMVLTTATLDGTGHATTMYPFILTTHVFARYEGDSNYGSKTAAPVYQQLNKATTSLSLSVSPNPAVAGQQIAAMLQLSIMPPGSAPQPATPFGTYTLFVDNMQVASVSASGTSQVNISLPNQPVGDRVVTATYSDETGGYQSTGYSNSSTGPVTLHVNSSVMATTTSATASGTMINVTVSAPGAGSTPTGVATVMNGAMQLGGASLDGSGQAAINITPLPPGNYTLIVTYTPSGNFTASSTIVNVNLAAPRRRTVLH